MKNALVADGGTGFTFPPCSAPAFVSGTNYVGGSQVSFDGSVEKLSFVPACFIPSLLFSSSYIWQANFFASSTPSSNPMGEWSASAYSVLVLSRNYVSIILHSVSACAGTPPAAAVSHAPSSAHAHTAATNKAAETGSHHPRDFKV